MSTDPQVSDLLLEWEERHEQGAPISVEELCRNCPQLLEEVRRKITDLQAMNPLVQADKQVLHEGQTAMFSQGDNIPSGGLTTISSPWEEPAPRAERSIGPLLA